MIEFHADDYGLFKAQSKRILDCCEEGAVNGISIIPDGSYLAEGMEDLRALGKDIGITVHLNLVEGQCLSPREDVKKLVDEKGNFAVSFVKLLMLSYIPFVRKKYRLQIKKELKQQIRAVMPYLDEKNIRLDSHCHYHMIPVVYDSLMDVIREEKLNVTYIRMPKEQIGLYWKCRRKLENFRWINLVKVICLNILCARNRRHTLPELNFSRDFLFIGIMFSGHMSYRNASTLLQEISKKDGPKQDVEILFHPGAVYEEEDIAKLTDKGDKIFLSSELRKTEAEALHLLQSSNCSGLRPSQLR